jgi:hypothetical protein
MTGWVWDKPVTPGAVGRTQLDIAPVWNGVATSSSPFRSLAKGDEDIAAPDHSHRGGVQRHPMGWGRMVQDGGWTSLGGRDRIQHIAGVDDVARVAEAGQRYEPGSLNRYDLAASREILPKEERFHAKNRPSTERVFCSNELAVYSACTLFNACAG